jgi:hypothetical protein
MEPTATRADIISAFRSKARVLHPDVPHTGDAAGFVAVKLAYDVLSNPKLRADYDRIARLATLQATKPEVLKPRPVKTPSAVPVRRPRFSDLPIGVWVGIGAVLLGSVAEAVLHMAQPTKVASDGIRPNAAAVAPLSPDAHLATLYGPDPVQLAGTPNFYVVPAATPAVLWRFDLRDKRFVPLRELPAFSKVQAVRLVRQNGMLEVLVQDQANGYVDTSHLTPGGAEAARQAYCSYNAGTVPYDGELLGQSRFGSGRLSLDNRGVQPAVVKLRDRLGTVTVSVFLAPNGHADLQALPEGSYRTDVAVGELWSRACGSFAAGMRAWRIDQDVTVPSDAGLEIRSDQGRLPSTDIADREFERN